MWYFIIIYVLPIASVWLFDVWPSLLLYRSQKKDLKCAFIFFNHLVFQTNRNPSLLFTWFYWSKLTTKFHEQTIVWECIIHSAFFVQLCFFLNKPNSKINVCKKKTEGAIQIDNREAETRARRYQRNNQNPYIGLVRLQRKIVKIKTQSLILRW